MTEFRENAPWRGYIEGLQAGKLRFQRCDACGEAIFYARILCPCCGATDLQWQDSRGGGTIYSVTEIPEGDGQRNVVLVDLDEGFRVMSTLPGQQHPPIGQRVRARTETDASGNARLVFDPEGAA